MARARVAVALLPQPGLSGQIQALRSLVGDPRLGDLPPHLTLIPPINLGDAALRDARVLLRSCAASCEPFELSLGPTRSFAPDTATLHLEVGGALDALGQLWADLRTGPFARPDEWPFVPHVTLREVLGDEPRDGAIAALTGELGPWSVDRVYLLRQHRDDGRTQWRPVVEERFGGPDVVGRGGVELVLRVAGLVEPEVARLVDDERALEPSESSVVVAAELPGEVGEPVGAAVGALHGTVARLERVAVAEPSRGMGVGRQLVDRWCLEAARRGADTVVADAGAHDGLLVARGFSVVGRILVRELSIRPAE